MRGRLLFGQSALLREADINKDGQAERKVDLTRERHYLLWLTVFEKLHVPLPEIGKQPAISILGGKENVDDLGIDLNDLVVGI